MKHADFVQRIAKYTETAPTTSTTLRTTPAAVTDNSSRISSSCDAGGDDNAGLFVRPHKDMRHHHTDPKGIALNCRPGASYIRALCNNLASLSTAAMRP